MTDNAEKIRQEKLEERKKVEAELKEHFGDRFKGFHVKWSEEDAKAEETEESEIAEDAEKESETIGGSVGRQDCKKDCCGKDYKPVTGGHS